MNPSVWLMFPVKSSAACMRLGDLGVILKMKSEAIKVVIDLALK